MGNVKLITGGLRSVGTDAARMAARMTAQIGYRVAVNVASDHHAVNAVLEHLLWLGVAARALQACVPDRR